MLYNDEIYRRSVTSCPWILIERKVFSQHFESTSCIGSDTGPWPPTCSGMIYLTTPPLYSDDHKLDPDDIANGNVQDLEVEIEELSCSGSSDQSSTENSFIQRISAMNRRGSEPGGDHRVQKRLTM